MTPEPNQTPAPAAPQPAWWQTIVYSAANIVIAALAQRYLGPVAAVTTIATGTAIAHRVQAK